MSDTSIRVVMIDDNSDFLHVYRRLFDAVSDIRLAGQASDGDSGIQLIRDLRPDVALLDAQMPGCNGIEVLEMVNLDVTRVVILTAFDLDDYVEPALRLGASGFLLKTASPSEIISAIRAAALGDASLAPEITRRLLSSFSSRP